MPSLVKQILSLPFVKGLSQREDFAWLAPGALLTAQNAVHPKTDVMSKRPGTVPLPIVATTAVPTKTLTIVAGKRLGSLNGNLVEVAKDAFTDAVFQHVDTPSGTAPVTPVFRDRTPEVYGFPPRVLAGGDGVVLDMDTCVCNGWLVHVWMVGLSTFSGSPSTFADILYQIESAATGEILIGASSIGQVPIGPLGTTGPGVGSPKIVACGTTAICTFCTGQTGTATTFDLQLYACALDCSATPTAGWQARQSITALPAPPYSLTGGTTGTGSFIGVYDLEPVTGDATKYIIACATGTATATTNIQLFKCSVANTLSGIGPIVTGAAPINGGDATWTADGATHQTLTGIAIHADAVLNEVFVSYAWSTDVTATAGTSRCSSMLCNYTALAVIGTAVNLCSTHAVSPNPLAADGAAQLVSVARLTGTAYYKTYFSPNSSFTGTTANVPYIASYLTQVSAGAMTVVTYQPRVTFGVRLASKPIQRNGIGYLMGWVPGNQGTYFLFADDAWADISTPASFPLRLVGTFAPRLAAGPVKFYNQNALHGRTPCMCAFVLPKLVSNPSAQGGDVVYTILSMTQGQITVTEPSLFIFDFASPLAHQTAQVGQNMGIASACPSAFDGRNVFEFGFPYAPEVATVAQGAIAGTNLVPGATYGYVFIFERRDAAGQIHRSPRSPVRLVTMTGGSTSVSINVSTMGFSAREKCLAPLVGIIPGPQGYASAPAQVILRAFRTIAGGSTFFCLDPVDYVSGGGDDTLGNGHTAAIYNSTSVGYLAVIDGAADTAIQGNELLYSDGLDGTKAGSILDNECPPAFQCLIAHQNRFYGSDGSNVWASKAFVQGEGSGFNELMAFSVDDGIGPITALASMDSYLLMFKAASIYSMQGLGPSDSAGSNDWTPPARVAPASTRPRSIRSSPAK